MGFFFVFLLYTMRRVDYRRCAAIVVKQVPWCDAKRTLTKANMLFLARWALRLSWKETTAAIRTSREKVFDAVEHVVTWGLEHRTLGQIDAIGVDEIQYAKGHKYLTLVSQIDIGITRLLWVGKERTIESFQGFFTAMGEEVISKIVFVWTVRAYLLKEAFLQLWDYNSPGWAGKFLDEWCRQTMRSRIEPMKKIARSLRQHR
jgi:transposase